MTFGMVGSGSWATALVKILTEGGHKVHWCLRSTRMIEQVQKRRHNPNYLSSVHLNTSLLELTTEPSDVFRHADVIVIAVPSAYVVETLSCVDETILSGKKVLSAVKGILPQENLLLNDYLASRFSFPLQDYFTVMGPCHAEEVASEKLSYLTFSGIDVAFTERIAEYFSTPYINTVVNADVFGVQFAAVLKNIYAMGAGIAHGLEYGDNFLSVFIANCADEMAGFLQKSGIRNIEVGTHEYDADLHHRKSPNYASSVYLGDLLVTCYSLFSRNRTFGNMIGKGYSVKAAQLEMKMVAEGYNASRCIHEINNDLKATMPIADAVYRILWEQLPAKLGMKKVEETLI